MNSRYPSAVDYTLALQHPAAAFADEELRGATFVQGFMGPEGIAGSSAVVFHATIGGTEYALRCYTRQDASTPERYAALDAYVTVARLNKYVGTVTWFDREVLVKGSRWPVLTMEWIAGRHLNEYVGYLADEGNAEALRILAARWLKLIGDLQRAEFAHGDLQHGNVLVDTSGQFRLVDFDSVWIPPLRGQPAPTETGHPSYQPQDVSAIARWGPGMDTFPALVIYLALLALGKAPELWSKLNNGDNLLFERQDFLPPYDTEVWVQLAGLADPEIDRLTAKLRQFCAPGWLASGTLQDAIRNNWWERPGLTPTAPADTPPSGARSAAKRFNPVHTPVMFMEGALPPPPAAPYQSPLATRPAAPPSSGDAGTWWAREPVPAAWGTATPPTGPVFTSAQRTNPMPVLAGQPNDGSHTLVLPDRRTPGRWQRWLWLMLAVVGLTGFALSVLIADRRYILWGAVVGALLAVAGIVLTLFHGKRKRLAQGGGNSRRRRS